MAEDTMYLTVGKDPDGDGMIAVITLGQPQLGDSKITCLSIERVKDMEEAKAWYKRMKAERPWESRQ